MSMLNVTIIDKQQSICGTVHGSVANRMLAVLSEEPAAINELEAALTRFEKSRDVSVFNLFNEGICEEPYDAGVLIIDLKCRTVAGEQTYFALTREGKVAYHNGQHSTDVLIPYCLADDWQLLDSLREWRALCQNH